MVLSLSGYAVPIFRVTPMTSSFSVTSGTTTEVQYDVRNVSGRAIVITSELINQSDPAIASSAVSPNSTCENTSLANNSDCTLNINITGNTTGSETIRPVVCAFNGQLCSRASADVTVNVVARNSFNCATNSDDLKCRVFVTAGTYRGDLLAAIGNAADTTNCQNNASSITKGNCICEAEAAAAEYGHSGHWRAWLSSDSISAASNIKYLDSGEPAYVRATDANIQVAQIGQLLQDDPNLETSISQNAATVWTGSGPNGQLIGDACENWTTSQGDVTAVYGQSAATQAWSLDNAEGCNDSKIIYCFETPQ